MSVAECQLVVASKTETLAKIRRVKFFLLTWEKCKKAATELDIEEPVYSVKGNV